MKNVIPIFGLVILNFFFYSCNNSTNPIENNITNYNCADADGNHYKTKKIGNQIWMVENLNVGHFIPATTNQLQNGVIEKYCYDNDSSYSETEGGLYQWPELFEKDFCPKGWRIPTEDDWDQLIQFVGGDNMAEKLRDSTGIGFNSNYSGCCWHNQFQNGGLQGCYWTSTELNANEAKFFLIASNCYAISIEKWPKITALSVRCIKE